MSQRIEVLRTEFTSKDLRRQARKARTAQAGARMLAVANVLDGKNRTEAARLAGMTAQTLCDWIHRYNAKGLEGFYNSTDNKTGKKSRLNEQQKTELREIVIRGPDLKKDGVVRWRCCDLNRLIEERFGVLYHERYLGRLLKSLGLSRITARPRHLKGDPEAQESFKKTSLKRWSQFSQLALQIKPSRYGGKTKPASAKKAT